MRKNNLLKSVAFILLIVVTGCSSNNPRSTAERFFKAMSKNDFDAAKKFGTEDTGKILDMLKGFQNMFTPNAKREHKYEIISEKTQGDSAVVMYKIDSSKTNETLNLVKEAGVWKVAMSIDNMDDGGEEPIDTGGTTTDEDSTKTR